MKLSALLRPLAALALPLTYGRGWRYHAEVDTH